MVDVDADFAAPAIVDVDEGFDARICRRRRRGSRNPLMKRSTKSSLRNPGQPVVVGSEDPWTEEELSGVYSLGEVEKAEQAASIEAARRLERSRSAPRTTSSTCGCRAPARSSKAARCGPSTSRFRCRAPGSATGV